MEKRVRKRNRRNSFIKTYVKGIRADSEFWAKCDLIAKSENTTRNDLIVSVVNEYCNSKVQND